MLEDVKEANQYIKLSDDDKLWLKKEYPDLEISKRKLSGEICFQRTYNEISILDCYNIEVLLKHNNVSMLPKVSCLDKKIVNIAKYLNLEIDKLHINSDGSFCLTVYPKEKFFFTDGIFNIQEFFINLLEPYLYWISFYEKYKKLAWEEYSHGILGILEYIQEEHLDLKDIDNILKDNNISLREIISLNRQNNCLCEESK